MPRAASRIFLRVTDVRIERIKDISNADAIAEGFYVGKPDAEMYEQNAAYRMLADNLSKAQFGDYWDKLNAKRGYGWGTDPWVWVISFERLMNLEGAMKIAHQEAAQNGLKYATC